MSCYELFTILKRYSEKMEFNSGCLQKTLDVFQKENRIILPLSLGELLMCFDGGELFVPGTVIYGTGANGGVSLKDANRGEIRNLFKIPRTYLVFAKVNYGDLLCIDLNNNNEIIQWDHELDEEFCRWKSLEEWLKDTIDNSDK